MKNPICILIILLLCVKPSQVFAQDSLELDSSLSAVNMQRARWEYERTSLWRRLIPQITAGISLSKSQYILPVYDESSAQPSLLGRGGYHITLSWNMSDLFFADARKRAYFELRHSTELVHITEYHARRSSQNKRRTQINRERDIESQELVVNYAEQELVVHRQLLELTEIKFNQAEKTAEDVFQRKLAVLNAERKLAEEKAKLESLRGWSAE